MEPRDSNLSDAAGYRVEATDGRFGVVVEVLYDELSGRPEALAVLGGIFGTRVSLVPAAQVERVEPRAKCVRLRSTRRELARRCSAEWSHLEADHRSVLA